MPGPLWTTARRSAETLLHEGLTLVSGGTDNHLLLVRLPADGPTGKDAAAALEAAGLVTNKNTVPFDARSPFVTSGIRMGSPAATTFGFRADEFRTIGRLIARVLRNLDDDGGAGRRRCGGAGAGERRGGAARARRRRGRRSSLHTRRRLRRWSDRSEAALTPALSPWERASGFPLSRESRRDDGNDGWQTPLLYRSAMEKGPGGEVSREPSTPLT